MIQGSCRQFQWILHSERPQAAQQDYPNATICCPKT